MIKRYKIFLEKRGLEDPDPFGEEDWYEVENTIEVEGENWNEDDLRWSEYEQRYYTPEDDEVVLINDDWIHIDNARWSEYDNEFYHPDDEEIIWVESNNGGDYIHRDHARWSEYDNEFYHPDDEEIIWVENSYGGDYIHRDDAKYSEYHDEFFHPDDNDIIEIRKVNGDYDWVLEDETVYSTYYNNHIMLEESSFSNYLETYIYYEDSKFCEHDNDNIPNNEVVSLSDGTYTHKDNAVEDINGDLYHIDTVEWDDDKEGYIHR